LEDGEVLFPPDELGVLWAHGGHHVIEIHDDVDESVEHPEESGVSARCESDAEPDAHRHDTVMNDVKNRDLVGFLA
jgi:hypothetical protein